MKQKNDWRSIVGRACRRRGQRQGRRERAEGRRNPPHTTSDLELTTGHALSGIDDRAA
jgi:hypothetical protein